MCVSLTLLWVVRTFHTNLCEFVWVICGPNPMEVMKLCEALWNILEALLKHLGSSFETSLKLCWNTRETFISLVPPRSKRFTHIQGSCNFKIKANHQDLGKSNFFQFLIWTFSWVAIEQSFFTENHYNIFWRNCFKIFGKKIEEKMKKNTWIWRKTC